jgi:hypothetical protein
MNRRWLAMLMFPVYLSLSVQDAEAQFDVLFSGSTPQGDFLRGDGVSAYGRGMGYYFSSLARSVDATTLFYQERNANLSNLERRRRYQAFLARQRAAYAANRRRIEENPNEVDIRLGNPLNDLFRKLTGPGFHLSALRQTEVALPAGSLGKSPLFLAGAGIVIAPDRLRAEGRWPSLLLDPAFAPGRRAYERAVAVALEQVARGGLQAESVTDVERAIRDLQDRMKAGAPTTPSAGRGHAQVFLGELAKSARMLRHDDAVTALRSILNDPGTSVAALLDLMQRHHLQFGAAETPTERALYRDVYSALSRQRGILTARL